MTDGEVVEVLDKPLATHEGNPRFVRWYGPPGSTVGEDGRLHVPPSVDWVQYGIVSFDLNDRVIHGGQSIFFLESRQTMGNQCALHRNRGRIGKPGVSGDLLNDCGDGQFVPDEE